MHRQLPAGPPGGVSDEAAASPFYIGDPWDARAVELIPQDAPVLIMGTGLTTADLLISLNRNGHRGPVTALSRRGLLPSIHQEARSYPSYIEHHIGEGAEPPTTAGLMRLIREEVRRERRMATTGAASSTRSAPTCVTCGCVCRRPNAAASSATSAPIGKSTATAWLRRWPKYSTPNVIRDG